MPTMISGSAAGSTMRNSRAPRPSPIAAADQSIFSSTARARRPADVDDAGGKLPDGEQAETGEQRWNAGDGDGAHSASSLGHSGARGPKVRREPGIHNHKKTVCPATVHR